MKKTLYETINEVLPNPLHEANLTNSLADGIIDFIYNETSESGIDIGDRKTIAAISKALKMVDKEILRRSKN